MTLNVFIGVFGLIGLGMLMGMFIGFMIGKSHQINEIRAEYARAFRCFPEGQ